MKYYNTRCSSEPGQGTRHFEQDLVALGLLPDDAPSGMLPVKVKGDGSCLFHAVSLAVAALDGDHQDPASLRTKCADELAANAASYARVLEEKAEQCAKLSSDFSKKSLILSCLSDEAAKVLERRPAVENLSTALEKALLTESETARLRNSWTSLPHLAALATCLKMQDKGKKNKLDMKDNHKTTLSCIFYVHLVYTCVTLTLFQTRKTSMSPIIHVHSFLYLCM